MVKIVESRHVPLPLVKELLDRLETIIGDNPIVSRAREHAHIFSKCDSQRAVEAMRELQEVGFTEFAASILVSIVPKTFGEAKAILGDIDGGYSDEFIKKALSILDKYCGAEKH